LYDRFFQPYLAFRVASALGNVAWAEAPIHSHLVIRDHPPCNPIEANIAAHDFEELWNANHAYRYP
jgi:hypothetical protein